MKKRNSVRMSSWILFISIFYSIQTQANCLRTRAIFDIGSANTKLIVASVNICKNKILNIFEDIKKPVQYKKSLGKVNELPKYIRHKGIKTLRAMKAIARKHSPDEYLALVTGAINKANNGKKYLKKLEEETGFKISPISESQEAILGLISVHTYLKIPLNQIAVWDIGASTMHFSTTDEEKEFKNLTIQMGAVPFMNSVIKLKGSKYKRKSPNPIGKKISQSAISVAELLAKKHIPNQFRAFLHKKTIVGIGGVHFENIRKEVKEAEVYNQEDLKKVIDKKVLYSDKEVGGKFAATNISNLILILGFMKELNIDKVRSLRTNFSYGALVHKELWE